jgi:rhodanese-related sulfurtransferase
MLKQISLVLALLVVAVIPAGLNVWLNPVRPPWNPMQLEEGEVNLTQLSAWSDECVLVDARSPDVYEAGHIPDAINVYAGTFDDQVIGLLEVWNPEHAVVVYCGSRQCGASEELAKRLRDDFQMDQVYVLKGGWQSWLDENGGDI